jgi:RNA polymerase sigma-70 factor (ECF subfamily)
MTSDRHPAATGDQLDSRPEPDRRLELERIFADEDAFRAWYDVAARRLYAYLFGRCGGDPTLAEDLTQQAFVQAVRHRASFDGRSDPITWLIAIGRNRLIDHLRREEREERRRLRLIVREIPVSGTAGPGPGAGDERADIVNALHRLPAAQRAALILHHVDGLPVREVATALDRTEGAVEALLSRGRAGFRAIYEESDGA